MSKRRPLTLLIQPQAHADIEEIGDYIARDNRTAAQQLVKRFHEKCGMLVHYPEMGQQRPDIRKNLRHFPVGAYVILYRVKAGTLDVVRVIHGARLHPKS